MNHPDPGKQGELSAETTAKFLQILRDGDAALKAGNFLESERLFEQTRSLFPENPERYHLYQIVCRRFISLYRKWGRKREVEAWLLEMTKAYDEVDYLLEGQVALDFEERERAFQCFDKTFKMLKKRAFQGLDPKYLEFYLHEVKNRQKK